MSLIFVAICSLFLAGCCTSPHHVECEYKVVRNPHTLAADANPNEIVKSREAFLNDLGKDGWILVTKDDGAYYFIRAKKKRTVTVQ